jgi:hypothetical protein
MGRIWPQTMSTPEIFVQDGVRYVRETDFLEVQLQLIKLRKIVFGFVDHTAHHEQHSTASLAGD